MKEVFLTVDLNKNATIEVTELIDFFGKNFGPYANLFSSVEHGHEEITKVLQELFNNYDSLDWVSQFKVRFYLKEYLNQVVALHKPIRKALKKLHSKSKEQKDSEVPLTQPNVSAAPHSISDAPLLSDLLRLLQKSKIILPLEDQVQVDKSGDQDALLVSRTHKIDEGNKQDYVDTIRSYIAATKEDPHCKKTYIQQRAKDHFTLYEIWDTQASLTAHYKSKQFKENAKALIDLLAEPEILRSLPIPKAWVTPQ
uniref:ABM domain-containing protein n=1 Tax=Arcella intermedia TaxID=1963864 RepID=A0A6B2LC92_9EUKA